MTGTRGVVSRIRTCIWAITLLVLIQIAADLMGRYIIGAGMSRALAEHDTRVRDTVIANQRMLLRGQDEMRQRLDAMEGRRR